ncbi:MULTISPECIES: endonuclease/exonuclease/phosphatase family protein [unclassified Pseudomonas]|uniref:endonuclease/exonuclease/phosphatase family protein n=1 Tax=unclassified Pseudomonas TaxID=196821 RepID=UPI0011EFF90C|nr:MULTISPECIES: endonuclease/exonuclease/phosphatase family protein [unclassified Pseudomonas]KAA0949438.1 endonuclease/exonuclease/phosphatase family protein [Pseudomonas sp. ANT_H4]KAA0954318.1 endonuclease/exonuclease/phosphatase family protein [Pseudomonas sp. ANT_H14]
MTRLLRITLLGLLILAGLLTALIYSLTWRPGDKETLPVRCVAPRAPTLLPGQAIKVMTWNVQYLAGKRYVFWYDTPDGSGPDDRPTVEDMAFSLDEVARVIRDEQPDILLLQELDEGAKPSHYQDQLTLLQERLVDLYPCSVQAFDWKADFVPDLHIFGSVGRKLVTLSRYQIEHAERLQLPVASANLISRQFQPKPALLLSYLPLNDGGQLAVLNTRLDSTAPGHRVVQDQVQVTVKLLDKLESRGTSWLIGGDFNLLPLGQFLRLDAGKRGQYSPDSELHLLWEKYPMIPSNSESSGIDRAKWLTHVPNDPSVDGPDRTLDYLFYSSRIKRVNAHVRQDDTLRISNHLPVIGRFLLPAAQ